MVTVAEVVNWASGLANKGIGYDNDGAYGAQCVDLTAGASLKFFGKSLYGNGVDMLDAARSVGYRVETSGLPRAGAFFAATVNGSVYGHTGLVIGDPDGSGIFKTIEQNIDGTPEIGGPARYTQRRLSGNGITIFGWFYPPYSDLDRPTTGVGSTPTTPTQREDTMAIHFRFNIKGDPNWNPNTVFYYNGAINEIQGVHNTEEDNYLQSIYKETTGREMKGYTWDNNAPVHVRIFGVLNPGSQIAGMDAKLEEIRKLIQQGL